jgi:hypothetical protein
MFVNFIATRNPHMIRYIHVWTRVQQTKIYEAVCEAVPSMI